MSLTGFNRLRRAQRVEAMKPENIMKSQPEVVETPIVEQVIEEPKEEIVEAPIVEEAPVEEIKEEVIEEPIEEATEAVIDEETTITPRRRNNRRK